MALRRNKPRHALYGLAAGAQALGTSFASGLEGLALKPIEGAESGGAGGFFKGIGKGLVGAVTKPVVGVFDFASTATQGIRNTTTVFEGNDIDRIRLPRFIAADGVLRVRSLPLLVRDPQQLTHPDFAPRSHSPVVSPSVSHG